MSGGCSVFPNSFCSAKGPPGCPGWDSNPGPTEWQAWALTIEPRLTQMEDRRMIPGRHCFWVADINMLKKYELFVLPSYWLIPQ